MKKAGSSSETELTTETIMNPGDSIITAKGGSAELNYPDGSSVLIKEESRITIKDAQGRKYVKVDGQEGIAVDWLNLDMQQGTMFAALAAKHESSTSTDINQEKKTSNMNKLNLASLNGREYIAAAAAGSNQEMPWYEANKTKKVKVKVDMPWGVAAVRGTFVLINVVPGGQNNVSCLTGDASVSNAGQTVDLGQNQSTAIGAATAPPAPSAPLTTVAAQQFAQEKNWIEQTAQMMDQVQATVTPPPPIPSLTNTTPNVVQSNQQSVLSTLSIVNSALGAGTTANTVSSTSSSSSGGSSNSVATTDYNTPGIYGAASAEARQTLTGNVNVGSRDITLQNMIITGVLTLGTGIGDGSVTLKNVKVQGSTNILGGGPNSIHVEDCELYTVIVNNQTNTVRIVAKGSSTIGAITLNSGAKLEENSLSSSGFSSVTMGSGIPAGATVILSGNFEAVNIAAPGLNIQVAGGSIQQMNIASTAGQTVLTLASGTNVGSLQVNAAAQIAGAGTIATATINVDSVSMEQVPAAWILGPGVASVSIAGQAISETGQSSTNISSVAVKTAPAKITYTAGESLDLSGLVVTLTKADSSAEDVAWSDFAAKGITTNINQGVALATSDTAITIIVNGKTASQAITVNQVPEPPAVGNNAPSIPQITMTPATGTVNVSSQIKIIAVSTDPDQDTLTYEWTGRLAETSTYPAGKQTVTVKAKDEHGLESPSATLIFYVLGSSETSGGLTLTGPESRIFETGIPGAIITNYTFTVPLVVNHYGEDHAWVKGLNIANNKWETLHDSGSISNGWSSSGPQDTSKQYCQLEFFYYTNHDCMYNKSNITYSVQFTPWSAAPAEAVPVTSNLMIIGSSQVGGTATGSYHYADVNGDLEGNSIYKWYWDDNAAGNTKQLIAGANGLSYSMNPSYAGKYLFFEVTPVAQTGAAGTTMGLASLSPGFLSATTITVTATPGTVAGNTKVAAIAGEGGQLQYAVSTASMNPPTEGSTIPAGIYTNTFGGEEMTITVGNYIHIFEINNNYLVTGYGEHKVVAEEVYGPQTAATTINVTVTQGTATGKTNISASPMNSGALKYELSNASKNPPFKGASEPVGLTGFTTGEYAIPINNFIHIYEIYNNVVTGYGQHQVVSTEVYAAAVVPNLAKASGTASSEKRNAAAAGKNSKSIPGDGASAPVGGTPFGSEKLAVLPEPYIHVSGKKEVSC